MDPDQMLQSAASDQCLHCLPLIHELSALHQVSKMDLFKILGKVWYGAKV